MSNMTTLGKVIDRVHKMSEYHTDRFVKVENMVFQSLEKERKPEGRRSHGVVIMFDVLGSEVGD